MPKPLGIDLRKRIVSTAKNGAKPKNIAKRFGVSLKTVHNWINLEKKNGSLEAKSGYQKGHSHKIKDLDEFRQFVEEAKFSTIAELQALWQEYKEMDVCHTVIYLRLRDIGYTVKKKHFNIVNQMKKVAKNIWMR